MSASLPESGMSSAGADSVEPCPLFQPFAWHSGRAESCARHWPPAPETKAALDLAGYTLDIARGVGLVLAILERERLDDADRSDSDPADRPLLSRCDRGNLERMAITSLTLLGECADRFINSANART